MPKGGLINDDVMIGGKQAGAAAKICFCIVGITTPTSSGDTVSAFVMTDCNVNLEPPCVRHRWFRDVNIAISVAFSPCFALNKMYTRRNLIENSQHLLTE